MSELSKIAQQVYEVIVGFKKEGRDATRRRIAAHFLRGKLPVKESERDALSDMRGIVDLGLRELRQKKLVRQVIDAWVPT